MTTPRQYWTVEPQARDTRGKIRRYQLRWNGARLSYLKDGFTCGSYRTKQLADARALALNTSRAKIEAP